MTCVLRLSAVAFAAALAVLAAGSSQAAAAGNVDTRFSVRPLRTVEPAIEGAAFVGKAEGQTRSYSQQRFLNQSGGGATIRRQTEGTSVGEPTPGAGCNLPETLAITIVDGAPVCALIGDQKRTLIDPDLIPDKIHPPSLEPPISALGGGVDALRTQGEVRAAADLLATRIRRKTPLTRPLPALFDSTVALMSNPLSSKRAHRFLIENLSATPGVTATEGMDPRGNTTGMVTVPGSSRAGVISLAGAGVYDLTESAQLEHQLFYDRATFDILATRTVLVSTSLPELQSYVDAPGPATITRTSYGPVRQVHRFALTQRRVPCRRIGSKDGRICIQIGKPGGSSISIG